MKRKIVTLVDLADKTEKVQAQANKLQALADKLQTRIDRLRNLWYLADKKAHFASQQAAGYRGLVHLMEKTGAIAYRTGYGRIEGGISMNDWIYPDKTNP